MARKAQTPQAYFTRFGVQYGSLRSRIKKLGAGKTLAVKAKGNCSNRLRTILRTEKVNHQVTFQKGQLIVKYSTIRRKGGRRPTKKTRNSK